MCVVLVLKPGRSVSAQGDVLADLLRGQELTLREMSAQVHQTEVAL